MQLPPTPDQIPSSSLGYETLSSGKRSATLDLVLVQLEELTSRLKVALRRIEALEMEREEHRAARTLAEDRALQLTAEAEVLRQSARAIEERYMQFHEDRSLLERERDHVRELWAQERLEFTTKIQDLDGQLRRAMNRNKRLVQYKLLANARMEALEKQGDGLRPSLTELKSQNLELKERIQSLVDRLQTQGRDFHEHVQTISSAYEEKLNTLARGLTLAEEQAQSSLEALRSRLETRVQELERENKALKESEESLRNSLRKTTEVENQFHVLERELQEANAWREAAENKSRENTTLLRDNTSLRRELKSSKQLNESLESQLTELQGLWSQTQEAIAEMQVREQSLQKVNRSLAMQLQSLREKPTMPPPQRHVLDALDEQLTQILVARDNSGVGPTPENAT